MERINKVFRNGEPLSAEELNGIVRYINELGETIEENLDDWSSLNAVEEMWNSLKEDDDSNRIHNSHSPLSYPLSSINGANLGLPPYSDMTIASDGNGGWLWKKVNQGGGGGGSSSLQGINKLRTYFLNVTHGTVPSAPSVNNYNSSPQDNFTNGQDVWTFTNTNPTNDLDTYAIWVWFLSNTPVNIDGPIKIFDGAINSSNGEDGEEIEWIYRRVSIIPSETTLNSWENTLANCIGSASAQDGKTFENADAIPFDWYDNPQGVTNAEKYEYASFRRSVNGSDGKRIWGTTGFCRPFIWSTYGEKGMDGDGIEYIFWGKAEAITNWNAFSLNSQNLVNYPPSWTNNEGFLNSEYTGPDGSSWTDDALGINDTTRRFIYMSKRKKTANPLTETSSWEAFSIPVLWNLYTEGKQGINGAYILEVYRNDTATLLANLSNIPSSDNRAYPPTGWTTSPQERSSNQFTWCMQRTMGYDEYNQASPGAWGTPFRLTGDNGNDGEDGKYTEFIYKHFTSELTFGNDANNPNTWSTTNNNLNSPDNPLREDYTGPSGNKWSDNPLGVDDTYIYEYMCQRTFDGTNYGAFTNPVIWSKYGLNGRDGDGYEYIFKGFSSEQTSWNTNSDDYPPKWITSEASAFLGDDYLGPTGHTWADDAIGVDDTNNKFVYVCSRKKYVDLGASRATWHTFSAPKLWAQYVPPGTQGPEGRRGTYTLFIFKTTSSDLSNSANYSELSTSNSSIPSGWSETATSPSSSSEYIWGSHRLISFNTSNEAQYGAWVTPYRISGNDGNAVNGGHYEFRYKNYATLPNAPTGTGNTDGWSSSPSTPSASEKYTWMSLTYVSGTGLYGTWSTPIRITGPDGKKGADGNDIEFIYTRNNTGIAPSAPATTQNDDWYGTDSNNVTWTDNPQGVLSNLMYEYVSVRYKKNGTWGAYSTPVIWSKWGEKGQDGDGYEYIFKHFTTELTFGNDDNNPAYWGANLTDGYLGPNNYQWSNDPVGVNSNEKFEYVAIRKRVSGTWGQFSMPSLWSRYAALGADGGRYIFMYQNYSSGSLPSIVPDGSTSYTVTLLINAGWSYVATTPNFGNGLYTYMTQAFFADSLTSSVWTIPVRLTGDNGEPGEDGKYTEFIYKRFTAELTFTNDDDNPSHWATNLTLDYLGPSGHQWNDNPQGITSTYKFEYMSQRLYNGTNFGAFTVPVIWSRWGEKGQDGDGFEYIFKHFTTEQTFGNDDNNPAYWTANQNDDYLGPSGYQWDDEPVGVTSEYKFEYVTVRKKQNGTWGQFSSPTLWSRYSAQGADGGRYIFMYQNYTPSNLPSIVPDGTTSYTVSQLTNVGWAYTASTPNFQNGLYTYMTLAFFADLLSSAVWTVPIRITGDNGLPGEDGKYTEFIYKRFTTEQTFESDNNNPAYWEPNQNEDYLGPSSYLWNDNPLGITSTYKFEYISEREYNGINFGRFTTPVIWSKWGEKGMDGDGLEYIYKHFTTEQTFSTGDDNPANWAANQNSGYLGPTGDEWSDDPVGISSTYKFEYVSVRKKENGTWGTFSTPSLWSNYADTTVITPASTTVYQLVATISEIRYKRNHAGVVVWMPSTFNLKLFKFEGTTFTQLNSLPSGYSVLRIIDGTNSASTNLGAVNASDLASYTSNGNPVIDNNGNPVIGNTVSIEVLDEEDTAIAILNLSIIREFLRMLIPMGAYVSKRYDITDTTVPLVLGSNGKYYYLDADTNEVSNTYVDPTTDGQTVWEEATEFEVILTKALFADFAKLGSFVVYDKYFFSLFGYLYDSSGNVTYINSSSAAPAPYEYFDPNDPLVSTLPSSGHYKFKPVRGINAETGEDWGAAGNLHMEPLGDVYINGTIVSQGTSNSRWEISPEVYNSIAIPRIVGYSTNGNEKIVLVFDADDSDSYNVLYGGGLSFIRQELGTNVMSGGYFLNKWEILCSDYGKTDQNTNTTRYSYILCLPEYSNPRLYLYDNYGGNTKSLSVAVNYQGAFLQSSNWMSKSNASDGCTYVDDWGNVKVKRSSGYEQYNFVYGQSGSEINVIKLPRNPPFSPIPDGTMYFVKGNGSTWLGCESPIMNSHNSSFWPISSGYYSNMIYGQSHIFLMLTVNGAKVWIDFYTSAQESPE